MQQQSCFDRGQRVESNHLNQFQPQNVGPAYFVDIHFCSAQYPKQTQGNLRSEIYRNILGGGGGGDFMYAQKNPS